MDTQLQELIERIKTEGVKDAQDKADEIIENARHKANDIVAAAHEEASKIQADAKREAATMQSAGQAALKQAGRDLILAVRAQLTAVFDSVLKNQVAGAMTGEGLRQAIVVLMQAWAGGEATDLDVLLPKAEFDRLEGELRAQLAETLAGGVEIKPIDDVDAGFRISRKDGSAYYNFTADGIAEVLSEFLNPRLSEILKDAAKEA
jgi:V/A-type H+/Na+-transporting ATPase subunit E